MDRFGQVDIVVNNAGLMTFKSLEDLTPEDWQKVLNVDSSGRCTSPSRLPDHEAGGAIVNVASIHAVMTSHWLHPMCRESRHGC